MCCPQFQLPGTSVLVPLLYDEKMFVPRGWMVWVFGIFVCPLLMWLTLMCLTMFPKFWMNLGVEVDELSVGVGLVGGLFALVPLVPATAMCLTMWKEGNGFPARVVSAISGLSGVAAMGHAVWKNPVQTNGVEIPILAHGCVGLSPLKVAV